uniref:Ubiquitin-like domain-containing protein n=1 Tax=Ciona savignyi TaxID=51511 RepID=H2YCM5_CIOSA
PELTMLEGHKTITLSVCPTTGGNFELEIGSDDSIEGLRRKIARHLQTPRERLTILFKEKVLSNGTLLDHRIQDGNKITLLPTVESGFSSTVQGTQQSIIQAIESLSDVQIDDFLSGRSPLTLALRVGDHMMFVQLQLEQSMVQGGTPPSPHPTSSAAGMGGPTTGLLYKTTSRASLKRASVASLPHMPHDKPSHLDKLVTACSSLGPSTSLSGSSPKSSSAKVKSDSKPQSSRRTPRVMRHMQRLRRLCGAHQQCVAYSSPELASEISSIVHAAKHHSSASSPTVAPPAGACIDSFTTHGPGIFSGTFSGSLHPNIQDTDGRPKRDPQTILQILTDLLSATNHYQVRRNRDSNLFHMFEPTSPQQSIPTPPTLPPAIHATSVPQHPLRLPLPARDPIRGFPFRLIRPDGRPRRSENNTTRSKLQQLTHMMKQRKLRRKMRREACGPY